MSDILTYFDNWRNATVTFEQFVSTTNAAGQPIESWETVSGGENIKVNFWTDASRETNVNDRFVDQATGTVLIKPNNITFKPDTTMRFSVEGVYYYVEGFDDVAAFGDVYILSWRREI